MAEVAISEETMIVSVIEGEKNETVITIPARPSIVLSASGPQGAIGPTGQAGLIVNESAKVNGSVVYYDANSSQFKADANWTTNTLTDGGNF
jgi:hypothetical protein